MQHKLFISIRPLLLAIATVAIALLMAIAPAVASDAIEVTVYRDAACRCCGGWMEHLRAQGFQTISIPTDDMEALKQQYGVPADATSCHTAVVQGYLIEGHVPVADIQRLLANRPQIAGIAVPGMPIGTPGMESGEVHDPFTVVSFDSQGNTAVFNEYLQ